ncbi:MAG TPA: Lrp/AsnC family transcriptional regulator [Candidatus Accumulibacter phosphatis]|nr:MAG: HTH-type transcriptional regulator LrpC [Candidatus Accumulibacter sp. SK-11]HAY25928.1 Lrp/AsnC family transcriptional regulator [Accumulibacter sp.]HCN69355.1 Lrp/AsnC family transcriptional regulator [Accumulibacter sp.]HRL76132.1 Lrp/AsnC family transcriptional regulator [Candidatus Accumulibacter phosphatis]HRQ95369.1 Lrp/AsnC family transcriptional regulator [Candidatus Accumulibacter phosphatis]
MELDAKAWKILAAVQRDGRTSLKALAAEAGLSLPAVSERLKRLEEAGVVTGYRAEVDVAALGYGVLAMIAMTTPQTDKARLLALLRSLPEVTECLHVTGQDSYLLRVVARDIAHLEQLVGTINHYGETRTSIVMSAPIPLRPVSPPRPSQAS